MNVIAEKRAGDFDGLKRIGSKKSGFYVYFFIA